MAQFNEEKQIKDLQAIRTREEEALVQQTAQKIGVQYIDLTGIGVDTDALKIVSEKEARNIEIAPFKLTAKELHLATRSPLRQATQTKIKELEDQGYNVTTYMVSQKSLAKAWDRYKDVSLAFQSAGGLLDISDASLQKIANDIKTNEDVKKMFEDTLEEKMAHKVSRLMEILFGAAIATGASDIHIEAQEDDVRIRFRQDGVLHDVVYFDHDNYHMINSRIKLLSSLKLTQTQNAQDGRFTIEYNDMNIEIRTSIVPGAYGEGIVMRILNPEGINVGLEQLGIPKRLLKILKEEVAKPNGLILNTGPTGSGKTTTLYSFLKYIYNPEIKILTIEDPIEYHLEGITQTQVDHDKGYDFLAGLRAAMRQDPDVALVGEIRDNETATIAVNASLTGHLVLSTLHTNNAAGAIPRLLDLGVVPGVLAAALSTAIAQRLVRKLCPECKKRVKAEGEEAEILRTTIRNARALNKSFEGYDIDVPEPDEDIYIYKPQGCEACSNIGYKGRLGVYEAILADENIQKILEDKPSERMLKIAATAQGIMTMKEDGVAKILEGITSLQEIQEVVDLEEDLELFEEMQEYIKTHHSRLAEKAAPIEDTPELKNTKNVSQPITQTSTQQSATIAPLSTNPPESATPISDTSSTEISLLVDYLKLLEQQSTTQPDDALLDTKIQSAEHVIAQLLKDGRFTVNGENEAQRTEHEINLLMEELQGLRNDGATKKGIADKLASIRSTIETL